MPRALSAIMINSRSHLYQQEDVMLAPATALLLASYVGPVPSPDVNLDAYRYGASRDLQRRTHQTPSLYEREPSKREGSMCIERMSPSECAARGRMVVPRKFR